MPEEIEISFFPTKRFFVETLTRDVTIYAAIFDLIDNSIDNYIIHSLKGKKRMSINFDSKIFCIEDDCGGMDIDKIQNEIFRLGLEKTEKKGTIGYYGIGLKRAMFKIGRNIKIESDDGKEFFSISIDEDWLKDDNKWSKRLDQRSKTKGKPMIKMTIKNLNPDAVDNFSSIPFQEDLINKIRGVHSIHIQKRVDIFINDNLVDPYEFKFLDDGERFSPLREDSELDGVKIKIVAGFTREADLKGWTVFCNDRIILKNDTSNKTGFIKVNFHPHQDQEFLGMVFFNSKDPGKLPMNTPKDDILLDNEFYKNIQERMGEITEELIKGLTRIIYVVHDEEGESIGKSIYEGILSRNWNEVPAGQKARFPKLKISKDKREETETTKFTTISYQVEKKDIRKVKKHMGNPAMSNKKVGIRTYEYYKKMEDIRDD